MIAAQLTSAWNAGASLVLIAMAVALSRWRGLGVERSILWASLRAAVQLVAVGLLFTIIFESAGVWWWAWGWVLVMVLVSGGVVQRRSPSVPGLRATALVTIGGAVAVSLLVVMGLSVLPRDPVTAVVVAGITIGNTVPSAVLAADRVVSAFRDQRLEVEGLLALGFDASAAGRIVGAVAARTALIPQIERTKIVGLIALPGAMTGLLLAGVDPVEAVLVQIVVMYLVLGSAALSVVLVTVAIARRAFTADLRMAPWTKEISVE